MFNLPDDEKLVWRCKGEPEELSNRVCTEPYTSGTAIRTVTKSSNWSSSCGPDINLLEVLGWWHPLCDGPCNWQSVLPLLGTRTSSSALMMR
jgi:hypothetical protein